MSFKFKQFTVHHDKCAMKVGMDGSLLGAWAGTNQHTLRVLDIGTGTGLIALMIAQRFPEAEIIGIDIQSSCLGQARENVESSPFAQRIEIVESSIQDFEDEPFDLIVCNPPFFNRSSKSGEGARDTARHDDTLSFSELATNASRLLSDTGTFALIIPEDRAREFAELAEQNSLHLHRSVQVRGRVGGPVKRRLYEFGKRYPAEAPQLGEISVENAPRSWTEEYKELLRDFYVVL
ncbi:tRNA1(Val) (adenine(37)-N6)-methyltransferase [Phaeocystidibacter luteus]|uniref:tRNA1(Val) (adenine(37)-N6)-methyltransferase n=1 Tax=Phaeocystidibacter luteus TaxID=911197 RepID=A0A6N6RIR0_9FLAO|nr:methyltransferase [Phaeocystidibacter luteus]KAB2814233.1 methyltransferase domain-containing protein [Phaeocystidibacter luteus]